MRWSLLLCVGFLIAVTNLGCRSSGRTKIVSQPSNTSSTLEQVAYEQVAYEESPVEAKEPLLEQPEIQQPVEGESNDTQESLTTPIESSTDSTLEIDLTPEIESATELEQIATPEALRPPELQALAESVRLHFPLIQQALASRTVASGEVLAASGAFDHKFEAFSNSQPLDFYENYRQSFDVKRDTYWGGEVFAGYRIGRGVFEPWYLERETNEGGEFKTGFIVPLARDRGIDANRAELWRSQLERGRIEPEIQAMIIRATRDAYIAYWQWVASTANYQVAKQVLDLGLKRKSFLERQVKLGEKADIELVDNERIILSRSAKLTDALRKLEQASVKLSLFFRDNSGACLVLPIDAATVDFPKALAPEAWGPGADIALAQANRPELEELQIARRQLNILLRQACNETRPQVDAGFLFGQDVGGATSEKRDKSEFELEATISVSVPLERRKALGKARQLRGKIAQLQAKLQFALDKVAIEAQVAHAALIAAAIRFEQTTKSLELAKQMQEAENRLYELGQSTLFNLNLREQQTVEAAIEQIAASFDYHVALADYAASLGFISIDDLQPFEQSQ